MNKIWMITTGDADVPKDLAEKYGIVVIPHTIVLGDKTYKDCVDITREDFYQKVEVEKLIPRTTAINRAEVVDVCERLKEKADAVIILPHSSTFGADYNVAVQAKAVVKDMRVEVVDTRQAATAVGLIVLEAAKYTARCDDVDKVLEYIEWLKANVNVFFGFKTLDYLNRSGRIGKAKALMSSVFKITPVLTVEDGEIKAVTKVRSELQANEMMVKIIEEDLRAKGSKKASFLLVHAWNEQIVLVLKKLLKEKFDSEIIVSEAGCSTATFVGAGAWSIAYLPFPIEME